MESCTFRKISGLLPQTACFFIFCLIIILPLPASGQLPDVQTTLGESSLPAIIAQELKHLDKCRTEYATDSVVQQALIKEMSAYRLQFSSAQNLLLMMDPDPEILSSTRSALLTSGLNLSPRIQACEKQLKQITDDISIVRLHIDMNLQRLTALQTETPEPPDQEQTEPVAPVDDEKNLQTLNQVLTDKMACLAKQEAQIGERLRLLSETLSSNTELSQKFDEAILLRKQENLFRRDPLRISQFMPTAFEKEFRGLTQRLIRFVQLSFYQEQILPGLIPHSNYLFICAALLAAAIEILRRLRNRLNAFHQQYEEAFKGFPCADVLMKILNKSVMTGGVTLFIYAILQGHFFPVLNPFLAVISKLLFIILATRWLTLAIDRILNMFNIAIDPGVCRVIRRFILEIRYFWILYTLLPLLLIPGSIFIPLIRLGFQVWILFWVILLWRRIKKSMELARQSEVSDISEPETETDTKPVTQAASLPGNPVARWVSYLIAGIGPLLDLNGYGELAAHWYNAWGLTLATGLWVILIIQSIREVDAVLKIRPKPGAEAVITGTEPRNPYPAFWFFSRIGVIAIGLLFAGAIAYFWGARQQVFTVILDTLSAPITVGSLKLSLAGLFYSLLVLFLTHAFGTLFKSALRNRILADSGMDVGLKESVTAISGYVIWAFRILIAMHVFGLDTTSMTVAFGALGIGLGFGLQTIFNNFFSGLILLFERPIQVGDIIEIDGTWAEVLKINVRSTLVQTYTNASLIIPNSELISNQVINWSHRDPWVRRDLDVGVAYGSNVEKVKTLLLEIANRTPEVRPYPRRPKVMFTNFGESSLDFRLRFWTHIDEFLIAESNLRFQIDAAFRENEIEIPFPQRDLHIRSGLFQPLRQADKI